VSLRKLLLLLLLPLAVLVWWVYHRGTEVPEVPFARVQRETLISTLPTNGKVEPIEWQAVRTEIAGLVEAVPVVEGQHVESGVPLARLSAGDLRAEIEAAEARVAQARAELGTIEAGGRASELAEIESSLARARFDLERAQRELASLERLVQKQAATRAELDAARAKVRQAELEIEALVRRRASLVGTSERAVAQARLRDAEAALALARSRREQTVIRAPMDGVVYGLAVRAGAYLNAGDLVGHVGRLQRVRVRVYVDEPELGRVEVGQPVTITWDALPGRKWTGTVERKATEIVSMGTRHVGEVLCTIDNPGRELVPGTNVNVEIRTSMVENALTIPKEALRREGGAVGVLVLRDDALAWQEVATAASSATRVQVTSGLQHGDSVALPTERVLRPGERVRPVYP
jgi:HlyD family secretion protein